MLVAELVPYFRRVWLILVQFRLRVPKRRTGVKGAPDDLGLIFDNVSDSLRETFVYICIDSQ